MQKEIFSIEEGGLEAIKPGFQIEFPFIDPDTKREEKYVLTHSVHSRVRADQRGIDHQRIKAVMAFGESVYKQGMVFMYIGEDHVPNHLSRQRDKYINTVVVMSGDSKTLITCYRCTNPARYLRRKPKFLIGKKKAA